MLVIALLVLVITAAAWRFLRTTSTKFSPSVPETKSVPEGQDKAGDSVPEKETKEESVPEKEEKEKSPKKASGPASKPEEQKQPLATAENVEAKTEPDVTLIRHTAEPEMKETVVESTNSDDGSSPDYPACS